MSYVRWSSDNWKSDVYVYQSENGFEVHVAGSRYVDPIPELPEWGSPNYWETYRLQMAAVEKSARRAIGGDFDGQDFTLATLEELRDKLREISAAGYHVPEYVFEAIESEISAS